MDSIQLKIGVLGAFISDNMVKGHDGSGTTAYSPVIWPTVPAPRLSSARRDPARGHANGLISASTSQSPEHKTCTALMKLATICIEELR